MLRRYLILLLPVLVLISLRQVSQLSFAMEMAASPGSSPTAATEPLFDGLGPVHHRVTTQSRLAQRYFDQGLAFVYAFNHDEAQRSFEQAARIDPNMAMAYWGVALVLGPNYNLPGDKERGRHAYQSVQKAQALAKNASPVERDLIAALTHRYGPDGEATAARDKQYADAMRGVADRYPDDADVQTLFAESLMDLHPWQLWNADGTPGPDTQEIVSTLEGVLRNHRDHVGANHYYIHAMEASRDPGRALSSAERLGKLAPGAGHLVHMPAHIYIRTGRYHDSTEANARAIQVDRDYIAKTGASGVYPLMYLTHNIHFFCYSAMMEGRSKDAMHAARELESAVPAQAVRQMPAAEFLVPEPYFVEARFEQWSEILKEPQPPRDLVYTVAIWHYVRGLALAATGQSHKAQEELKALDAAQASIPSDRIIGSDNSARKVLDVASAVLAGEIAAHVLDHDSAVAKLSQAVALQDALGYEEPPIWYFPVRESLAAELLAAGRIKEAEQVYRDDLVRNPENPRSLYGLSRCLSARGEDREAVEAYARFQRGWRFSDVDPSALVIASQRQP